MNVPAKLLGLLLLGGGFLTYLRYRRAQARGFTGPRHRRIHADTSPLRFRLALASHVVGVLVCLFAAVLCFTHGFRH